MSKFIDVPHEMIFSPSADIDMVSVTHDNIASFSFDIPLDFRGIYQRPMMHPTESILVKDGFKFLESSRDKDILTILKV